MKQVWQWVLIGSIMINGSCLREEVIHHLVLNKEQINVKYLSETKGAEQALLSYYLLSYGNECAKSENRMKCEILRAMGVDDECASGRVDDLLQWFAGDVLIEHKLKHCPPMPAGLAIHNQFKYLDISRKGDSLAINYCLEGINQTQEKTWNICQIDLFLIEGKHLKKIASDGEEFD